MILVGLTGSIGMGKTTTAGLFAEVGAPVYDADAAVHEVYGVGGAAVGPVEAAFPGVTAEGAVHRGRLGAAVLNDPDALKRLEMIVHPLLGRHREQFFERARAGGKEILVFDVPLLFETGGDQTMDAVVVVSSPMDVQRARVLSRPGMTPDKLDAILARQLPDAEKQARADFVIDTSQGIALARDQVLDILKIISDPDWRSRRRG
jgi:dephospho-CoA kinase